jgi:8-oxo-dGTP pyrophosphatase MutT (NUDIX family)
MTDFHIDINHQMVSNQQVFAGPIFTIDQRVIDIQGNQVMRQIVNHAPVVYILAHNIDNDTYLLEKEYRSGVDAVCYGLPAGFIDDHETPMTAAQRELQEETGLIVQESDLEHVGDWHSSQGFTNELAHVYRVDVHKPIIGSTSFDKDEFVESQWVSWNDLYELVKNGDLSSATAVATVLHEVLLRQEKES